MKTFVNAIRNLERAMGTNRRIMSLDEKYKRLAMRRSIHVNKTLKAGHEINEDDLEYRRPGYGISPQFVDMIVGRKLKLDVYADVPLEWADIE